MALSFRRIVASIGIALLLPVVAHAQESATISGHVTGEGGPLGGERLGHEPLDVVG